METFIQFVMNALDKLGWLLCLDQGFLTGYHGAPSDLHFCATKSVQNKKKE